MIVLLPLKTKIISHDNNSNQNLESKHNLCSHLTAKIEHSLYLKLQLHTFLFTKKVY